MGKALERFSLDGRRALVTGASSGMGRHFVETLSLIHISEPTRPY